MNTDERPPFPFDPADYAEVDISKCRYLSGDERLAIMAYRVEQIAPKKRAPYVAPIDPEWARTHVETFYSCGVAGVAKQPSALDDTYESAQARAKEQTRPVGDRMPSVQRP